MECTTFVQSLSTQIWQWRKEEEEKEGGGGKETQVQATKTLDAFLCPSFSVANDEASVSEDSCPYLQKQKKKKKLTSVAPPTFAPFISHGRQLTQVISSLNAFTCKLQYFYQMDDVQDITTTLTHARTNIHACTRTYTCTHKHTLIYNPNIDVHLCYTGRYTISDMETSTRYEPDI